MGSRGDNDRLSNDAVVERADGEYVSSELGDELVILHATAGHYYGINTVGRFIWDLIDEPHRVGTVMDAVAENFGTTREECHTDVLEFLTDMSEAGLVELSDE